MDNSKSLKLIDETFQIEFQGLIHDFEVMSSLIKWGNSYTRIGGILHFNILKDFVNYSLYMERNKDLPQYIQWIRVYVRKPEHRLDYEEKKIQEFKDFISKKFKRANPEFKKWEVSGNSSHR